MSNVIDLSQVPAPDVVERIDYEAILADLKTTIVEQHPDDERAEITETLGLESEPLTKAAEAIAYLVMGLYQRINEAGRAVMLPYAAGADLDNLAALFGVQRLVTQEADPDADPPVPERTETDSDLRRRLQLSLEGLSVAGPEGAYVYHALSADGRVLDASAHSPEPGEVVVTVLSRDDNGAAADDLLDAVAAAVSADDVRPLTDHVTVQSATLREYAVTATLYVYEGPDAQVIVDNARAEIEAYTEGQHRLGLDVTISGIYAALHQPGVQRVELDLPGETQTIDRQEAPVCTGIDITYGGVDE